MRHQRLTMSLSASILLLLWSGRAVWAEGIQMSQAGSANRLGSSAVLLGLFIFLVSTLLVVAALFSRRLAAGKKESFFSSKIALALGVFGVLSGSILAATNLFKPASVMDNMQGMQGMSMDEMMRVDGSANPIPVTVETAQPGQIEASVRYTGSVRPYQEVTVYPRVEGRLTDYSVYPGDRVISGQTLARLSAAERSVDVEVAHADTEAAQAELQASRVELKEHHEEVAQMAAQYAYWQDELPRAQTLLNKGVISQEEFDKEKSEAMAAKAALRGVQIKILRLRAAVAKSQAMVLQSRAKARNAQIMKGYTVLNAPINGIVEERLVDPGVLVQPGMGILKVGDYRRVRLQANVAQQDLVSVQVGSAIRARVGGSSKLLTGRITSIFPKAGEETRTVTVEALIDNPGARLRSGQFLEMSLVTGQKNHVLSVPKIALTQFEGKPAVWVVAGKFAQRKLVAIGLTGSERSEIVSGLNAGEAVITSGQDQLTPNAKVAAVDDSGQMVASLSGDPSRGDAQVQLVSSGKAVMGDNQLLLQVKDAKTGQPLKVQNLEVNIAMPMKNMAPMATDAEVKPDAQPGRFKVNTYLGMQGEWEVTATIKDASHQGMSSFTLDNRQGQSK